MRIWPSVNSYSYIVRASKTVSMSLISGLFIPRLTDRTQRRTEDMLRTTAAQGEISRRQRRRCRRHGDRHHYRSSIHVDSVADVLEWCSSFAFSWALVSVPIVEPPSPSPPNIDAQEDGEVAEKNETSSDWIEVLFACQFSRHRPLPWLRLMRWCLIGRTDSMRRLVVERTGRQ